MIRIRNITKSFGSQVVLRNVSFDIETGKTTAIVGPSGVGKSVLMKMIVGMIQPDSGSIFVGDDEISAETREYQLNIIRRQLGVLFQNAALFDSSTVYDNIAFPLIERRVVNRKKESLSRKELHKKVVDMLEHLSLEQYAFSVPAELSMGMRKRVGLARSLITEPKFLLFDEPNTGLDPWDGQEVYDLIKSCREQWDYTGIVISHEIPEVFQVSDTVVMLLQGEVAEQGTPDSLTRSTNPAVQQFLSGSVNGPIKIQ